MIINHNLSAIFAKHRVKYNDKALAQSFEKISSGLELTEPVMMLPVLPYLKK